MKKWTLPLIILIIIAQFAVVLSMMARHERILKQGDVYRFQTRPIDPADPFQGRYVRLAYVHDYMASPDQGADTPLYGESVYVMLGTNSEGFCELADWSRRKPDTNAYLKLRYLYPKQEWNSTTKQSVYKGLSFDLPFNRFYMEESQARRADRLVDNAARTTNCWATIRVLNGAALVEDVYVRGTSIRHLSEPARK